MPQGYPPGHAPTGIAGHWSVGEVLGWAWERIKADPVTIVGAIAVGSIIAAIPNTLTNAVSSVYWTAAHGTTQPNVFEQFSDPVYAFITLLGFALNTVAQAFMMAGLTNFSLKVARGEPYAFADIFSGARWFLSSLGISVLFNLGVFLGLMLFIIPGIVLALARWFLPSLGISVLFNLGVFLGLMLFIIPGIFLALAWALALPAAVDRDLGAVEALNESFRLTTGHRWGLFGLYLALLGIGVIGLCACFVGVFVSGAIWQLSVASVYARLTATA